MIRTPRRPLAAGLAALLLATAACSGDDGPDRPDVSTADVLGSIADGVVIPSYEALVVDVEHLGTSLAALCDGPGTTAALEGARAAWRDSELAWQSSRAAGVGPAIQQRAMSSIAFRIDAGKVVALLAADAPVDPTSLATVGSDQRGLYGVEVALFGEGSDDLATASDARGRRCQYLRSATGLVGTAARAVLDAWTADDGYRDTFVAGMDGDPTSSVGAVVNELAFRLQQADDQGLRAMATAGSYDDLPASRRESSAAYGVASLRGILGGIAAVVLGPDGDPGLADLVATRSSGTADRLEALTEDAVAALGALPDSIAAAMEDREAVADASAAIAALRVLVTTEVASQLGVTIGFSDSDGDS